MLKQRIFNLEFRLFYIIPLLLLSVLNAYSFKLHGKKLETTQSTVSYIINNQYDKALNNIDSDTLSKADPLLPVLKLAAVGMRDVDYEKIIDSTHFLSLYKEAELSIELWEQMNGNNSYSTMLSGMTKAIHATFYLRQKKYVAAMQNGFDALELMRSSQNSDSSNYEVDFFLGLYEYAQSEIRTKLWWVLFWYPGNREQGIKRVKRCADNAVITGDAAKLSLCDIYLKDKRNGDAYKMIGHLKKKYPESRFVMWAEVKYFEAEKNYHEAAEIYGKLSKSYEREPAGEYNTFVTISKKAHLLYKANEITSASMLCSNILDQKEINKYQEIKKEITKLMERCNASKN